MKFDLHLHTYFSDGKYSPEELVDLALERNLRGIAITDHDTVLAIERAIKYSEKFTDFTVIPGIEFGCVHEDEEVHILGYFINYGDKEIIKATEFLKKSRDNRGLEMINKLKGLGLDIELEDVKKMSSKGFAGRVPIAKALIHKGYVSTIEEAFNLYLDRGQVAYVEKKSYDIIETINIIKKAGGISVLAHPGLLKDKSIIGYCIDQGIDGIECYHSKHTAEQMEKFKKIAIRENLIVTGGSDCHGQIIDGDLLLGKFYVNLESIPKFKERIK